MAWIWSVLIAMAGIGLVVSAMNLERMTRRMRLASVARQTTVRRIAIGGIVALWAWGTWMIHAEPGGLWAWIYMVLIVIAFMNFYPFV